jgi:hypothetical protein
MSYIYLEKKMSQHKDYQDYSTTDCMVKIMREIVDNGESSGWFGSFDALKNLEMKLNSFNIFYTDDLRGTWRHKSDTQLT